MPPPHLLALCRPCARNEPSRFVEIFMKKMKAIKRALCCERRAITVVVAMALTSAALAQADDASPVNTVVITGKSDSRTQN